MSWANQLSCVQTDGAEKNSDDFINTAIDRSDEAIDALADLADVLNDMLITFVEIQMEQRQMELDSLETHSNKIIATIDSRSHASFRGHDGGVSQASLIPSVTLSFSSGVRFSLGAGWTEKPEFHQNGSYFGAGVGISIGSEIEYAVTANISHSFPVWNFTLDPSLAISWGDQNGALVTERLANTAKANGKAKGKIKNV